MTTPLWKAAASFAARAHEGQRRADGVTPYFAHCARVAATVGAIFGCRDEVAIAVAFLHDTIEDTTTDYDDLEAAFGTKVASCVAALTKNAAMPEAERERDYDARLARADWRARLVKLADALDNFTDAATSAKRSKSKRKCLRAISLAKGDAKAHAETARAIAAVFRGIGSRR